MNTFGVFQTFYETGNLFTELSSAISWIGSIQASLLLLVGIVVGPIYDQGYMRSLLIVGTFGVVFGHMMLSICHQYWQVILAQGVCVGFGSSCLFVPCVSILPTYFGNRLGLAVGVAAAGSSLGGVIYPIVLYQLLEQVGFGWAVRTIAFIAFGTILVPLAVLKQRIKPHRARAFIDWSAFVDVHYMTFVLGSLIGFMGLFVLFFYISFCATAQHITTNKVAFYVVPILNAASCLGRTAPNVIADITGPFNLIAPGTFIVGILILCMNAVDSVAGEIIIAVLSGFFSGVFIGMPPLCFVALTKDKAKIGTRMGMGYGMIGLGVLAGGPAGGAILGRETPLHWHGLWAFGGVCSCVAGVVYAALRVARSGIQLTKV